LDDADHAALTQRQPQKTWAWKLAEGMLWRVLAKVIMTSLTPDHVPTLGCAFTDSGQRAPGGKVIQLPSGGKLHVWDNSMVRLAMRGILTFITSLTLLVPLVVLAFVVDRRLVVLITASCSVVLAIILAMLTQCRDHEIIMAVSA
jgi:hypothetical protein